MPIQYAISNLSVKLPLFFILAGRTNGAAYATVLRPSVVVCGRL